MPGGDGSRRDEGHEGVALIAQTRLEPSHAEKG